MSDSRKMFAACALLALVSSACTTRLVHKDLGPNPDVLVRQWTLVSRTHWDAGERGNDRGTAVLFENTLVHSNEALGLQAIYPNSQTPRWTLALPKGAATGVHAVGEKAYFAGGDGNLYCVRMQSGEVLWKYTLRSTGPSEPFVSGGKLYITTADDMVYAFDAGSGEWLWNYRRKSAGQPSIAGAASPRVVGEDLVVGLSDGYLVGLNPEDGALRWEKKLQDGIRFTDINATVLREGGVVYAPTYDGHMFALRERDREVLWRADVGGARQVTLVGDHLIVPSSDGAIVALDRMSGKVVWKFELDDGVPTEVTVAGQWLAFGSSSQYLYLIDQDGKGLFRFDAGMNSGFLSAPLWDATSRRLYATSRAGNLYSFSEPVTRRRGRENPYL